MKFFWNDNIYVHNSIKFEKNTGQVQKECKHGCSGMDYLVQAWLVGAGKGLKKKKARKKKKKT